MTHWEVFRPFRRAAALWNNLAQTIALPEAAEMDFLEVPENNNSRSGHHLGSRMLFVHEVKHS